MPGDSVSTELPASLSRPALGALAVARIMRLEDLTRYRESDIAALHGMGPKGIRVLREAMTEAGLAFVPER